MHTTVTQNFESTSFGLKFGKAFQTFVNDPYPGKKIRLSLVDIFKVEKVHPTKVALYSQKAFAGRR